MEIFEGPIRLLLWQRGLLGLNYHVDYTEVVKLRFLGILFLGLFNNQRVS